MRAWSLASAALVAAVTLVQLPVAADGHVGLDAVDDVLARAVRASNEVPHTGRLTIVSFGEPGPQVREVAVTRGGTGLRMEHGGGWELGRADGEGYLRSADTLLRVGGVERLPAQIDRLRGKYEVRIGEIVTLDTGAAIEVHLAERTSGIRREVLYVDEATGLIVRRETFGRDGTPRRLIAYTDLELGPRTVIRPAADGLDVREHRPAAKEVDQLRSAGFEVPIELPRGYELITSHEVAAAHVPTLHLLYGDGLYTVSVFQQRGRMARTAVRGASRLSTSDGGAVWRWPGSEPRRVVWSGDGRTFTVMSDAPTDELLDVVGGLPTDPPPSTLDRLARGLARVGQWLWPTDRSDT